MSKRKHVTLDLQDKIQILKDIDAGVSYSSITSKYGIGKATVANIKKNKEKIMAYLHENNVCPSNRKTLKFSSNPSVEKALFTWFIQEITKGSRITGEILREKAIFFYKIITHKDDFKASSGWLQKFKARFGIRQLTLCGESLFSDYDAVSPFVEELSRIINEKQFTSHQVYNAKESVLFWRDLPIKTLANSTEKFSPEPNVSKEHITFMPCSNASGSHKLKLLVLGKSRKPRTLRNETPVSYKRQRTACVTKDIFTEWFHNEFVPSVRRKMKELKLNPEAILLLDNAPWHPTQLFSDDNKISVFFFPGNCTPLIQPMDQHVIEVIKLFYHKNLLKKVVDSECDVSSSMKNVNLEDAVFSLDECWKHVSTELITKSWRKILPQDAYVDFFCDSDEGDDTLLARLAREISEPRPTEIENELKEITELGKKICPSLTKEEMEEWVVHDKAISSELTDIDMSQEIEEDCNSDSSDNDISEILTLVKDEDAVTAFDTCIAWATQNNVPEHQLVLLQELRVQAQNGAIIDKNPANITNVFTSADEN